MVRIFACLRHGTLGFIAAQGGRVTESTVGIAARSLFRTGNKKVGGSKGYTIHSFIHSLSLSLSLSISISPSHTYLHATLVASMHDVPLQQGSSIQIPFGINRSEPQSQSSPSSMRRFPHMLSPGKKQPLAVKRMELNTR